MSQSEVSELSQSEEKVFALARMAVSRASIECGLRTAKACGDYDWYDANFPAVQEINQRMSDLRGTMDSRSIIWASELTNASVY